jgi:hypothetical protein
MTKLPLSKNACIDYSEKILELENAVFNTHGEVRSRMYVPPQLTGRAVDCHRIPLAHKRHATRFHAYHSVTTLDGHSNLTAER